MIWKKQITNKAPLVRLANLDFPIFNVKSQVCQDRSTRRRVLFKLGKAGNIKVRFANWTKKSLLRCEIIAGVGSLLGGGVNALTQSKINKQNIAAQREFAQNSIQWKVQDAKAAGIHPLAALGASGYQAALLCWSGFR